MEAAAPRRTRALAAVAGACVLGALALSRVASRPKDAVVALSAASQPKETAAALSAAFGGDTDAEGCYTDAGYSWCAASSSCVRSWESSCDWVRSSRAAADATLSLVFALPVGDDHVAALEAEVAAVSDPASKRYGRHRSVAELDAYRADAHPEWKTHAARIKSYLDVHGKQFGEAVAYGSADEAARRGFLRAEVSVASAEELLEKASPKAFAAFRKTYPRGRRGRGRGWMRDAALRAVRSLSYLPADADPKSMARARTSFMVQLRGIACARLQGQPGSGRSGCGSGRRSRGAAGRRGEARGGCGGRGRPRARTCGGKVYCAGGLWIARL